MFQTISGSLQLANNIFRLFEIFLYIYFLFYYEEKDSSHKKLEISEEYFERENDNQNEFENCKTKATNGKKFKSKEDEEAIECLRMLSRHPRRVRYQLEWVVERLPEHSKEKYKEHFASLLKRLPALIVKRSKKKKKNTSTSTGETNLSKMITEMHE